MFPLLLCVLSARSVSEVGHLDLDNRVEVTSWPRECGSRLRGIARHLWAILLARGLPWAGVRVDYAERGPLIGISTFIVRSYWFLQLSLFGSLNAEPEVWNSE